MNECIIYLVKVSIAITLFYGFYKIVLSRDPFFRFNRIFLMGSLVFSFFLPLIKIPINGTIESCSIVYLIETIQVTTSRIEESSVFTFWSIIFYLYIIGIILVTGLFSYRLIQLGELIHKGVKTKIDGIRIKLLDQGIAPFSFWKTIFLPSHLIDTQEMAPIILHEKSHIEELL